jgi:DNA-binding CsgD family transcriptional regulator
MQLPQDARGVLLLVSAAGRLTMAQLQGMVDAATLLSALEAAADADVATLGPESVVTFTHPLLASAIYDAAAPAERRRVHRLLAETLEDSVQRARHRSRSVTVPDETVAAELEQAADVSRGRGAQQLAGELFEGAALATPPGTDTGVSFGRWLRAVDTYFSAGDSLAAQTALDKGSAQAVAPEQQAQVLLWRAWLTDDFPTARSVTEQAFRLAPPGSAVRAEILQRLGIYHRMQGHGRLALRLSQIAATEAAKLGRTDIQIAAINEQESIERLWGITRTQQTLSDAEPPADDSALDPHSVEWACARGFDAAWNDKTAEMHVRNGIAWAVDAGLYGNLSSLYVSLILFLTRASKIRTAQAALEEADRAGAWAASRRQEHMARILVKAYTGELDDARVLARHVLTQPLTSGSPYWRGGFLAQLGFIEVSARSWLAALDALRELADIIATTKMVDLEQLLWAVDYADAALQVGSMHEVETAIAILRRQAAAGRPEAAVAANRCEALLTAARGDLDEAASRLRRIVDNPGSECPFETGRSKLALGQVYRRAGYKAMAGETLNAAVIAFKELGISRWAQRARDEADRVGLHPSTGTLTATERRVAELVGAGHSNQEVAAELFMSVKTVEANLTRIYRKLAVRSRTELANRLRELNSVTYSD